VKVHNDLLLAADSGDVSALCLLDLTAAFDAIDYDLMMLKLFGLRGVVLDWFRSYLCGRTYRVIHGGKTSCTVHIICSVAQDSVLGLHMFILHVADLEDVAAKHSGTFMLTLMTRSCICTVGDMTSIDSKTALLMSVSGCPLRLMD